MVYHTNKNVSKKSIPLHKATPCLTQALVKKDSSIMAISYGDNEIEDQDHTGALLRIAAYGPQSTNVVGLLGQTDLFFIMRDAFGLPKEQ